MKIYHFAIIFAIFAISIVMIKDVELKEMLFEKQEIENIRGRARKASETAAWELRTSELVFDMTSGKRVIDAFFFSMYASGGMMDNAYERERVKELFPRMYVFLENGYYVFDYKREDGYENGMGYVMSEIFPYDAAEATRNTGFMAVMRNEECDGHMYGYGEGYSDNLMFSASVEYAKQYVIDADGIYHEEDCGEIDGIEYILFSKEGCAMLGAKPCRECIDR